MPNPILKPFDDEVMDVKKQSLYARLKALFSNDVIVRNVGGKQLKIKDTDNVMYATDHNSLRDRFSRIRSSSTNSYGRDFALSYQAARMDLFRDYDCVGPDTIIPLPDGTCPTIAELTEKYKNAPQERFFVFSYDHASKSIKLGKAYHPRKKEGTRVGYKVTFDNGQYVIGSIKHPFMMRNGEYKTIFDLKVGESVMPFYQKNFYKNGYRSLYNFSKGWQSEHRIVAEQFDRPLLDNEVVHHKNFNKTNNLPENLQIMTDTEHRSFHINLNNNIIWSPENKANTFKNEIESTLNHKIVSIESVGPIDVYDVTVEEYQNFATDSCFVHNTMDMDPIMSSALDIYADECLTYNELGKMLTVNCNNNNVKSILENLFNDVLNVKFNLWPWTRNMCKYGDSYLKLYVSPVYGVYMVEPLSPYNVERIENSDPSNKKYVKFQTRPTDTTQAEILENYEVAHFRLLSDSNFIPYGKSMLEGARRVWKQLSLMEDAMLIHRIMRAPEKRIFYTDIGNIPPAEVDNYMQKMMDKMKKIPYMDEQSGEYNLRFNLQNMVEDYYIPVRGGDSGTKIDTLGGMEWTGTEDIEYLRNKLMSALKIPKAFLGYEEGISGKATLASEDVRFARTIQRIQKILCSELQKIAVVHLYAQGYRDDSLVDFELELTNPSTIFEKEKIEIWADKVSVATDMVENKFFSYNWVYKNVFNMSEDDIKTVKDEIVDDVKQKHRFSKIEEDGDDPAKPFKKIGGGGSDDDDDDDSSGMDDLGDIGGGHGGGGGGGGLGDLDKDGEGGEGDSEGSPDDEGGKEGPDIKGSPEDLVKELKTERDQTGEHKASSHPFGEDPLGDKEIHSHDNNNSEGRKKSEIDHNFEGGTPLHLRENKIKKMPTSTKTHVDKALFSSLSNFMKKSQKDTKKELIRESRTPGSSSLMDERNIKE